MSAVTHRLQDCKNFKSSCTDAYKSVVINCNGKYTHIKKLTVNNVDIVPNLSTAAITVTTLTETETVLNETVIQLSYMNMFYRLKFSI